MEDVEEKYGPPGKRKIKFILSYNYFLDLLKYVKKSGDTVHSFTKKCLIKELEKRNKEGFELRRKLDEKFGKYIKKRYILDDEIEE